MALCLAVAALAQEKPQWTGPYALQMPEDHYRISLRTFDSQGRTVTKETVARIDYMIAHNTLFLDGEEKSEVHERFDYQAELGYNGGRGSDDHVHLFFGDGNPVLPENEDEGRDWFEEYAPDHIRPGQKELSHQDCRNRIPVRIRRTRKRPFLFWRESS